MKLSLSRRIALLVAILTLIVSVGLGFTTLIFSSKIVLNQAEEGLLQLAEEGVQHVEIAILRHLDVLQEIANRARTQSMDWDIQRQSILPEVKRLGYLDIAIVKLNGEGRYVLTSKRVDLGNEDCVKNALQGKAGISNVIIDEILDKPVVMHAVPIKEGEKVIGALVGRREGTALNDITDGMGFGENGYAYIMGADGTIYAHPDRDNVMKQENVLKDIENDGEFKAWGLAIEELGMGNKGVINYDYLGSKRYIGIMPMTTTDWVIGVGAHEEDILSGLNRLKSIIFTSTIIYIVIGILVALFLGKSISKPIVDMSSLIEKFSHYDLSFNENSNVLKHLKRKDEIGIIANSLKNMQVNLVDLIKRISESAQNVALSSEELTATSQQSVVAADEIARAIEEIASGATDQAKDTEEGALHINELDSIIDKSQQELGDINNAADKINILKDEGFKIIKELVVKTKDADEAAEEVYKIILNTNENADRIRNASEMIKSIAEQTNLLALNAAIEAARAGEAGRGFSVVAEEIRKLAEESDRFTVEIGEVIKELTNRTGNAVNTMTEVHETLQSQAEIVDLTNDKFKGIAESIEKMGGLIININKSSGEMKIKKDKIINIIQNLSATSEENAAGTEEASASVEEQASSMEEIANASEALAQIAAEMQEAIARFKY